MIVTLSGLPGSGKSTVAKLLVARLKLEYVNAGEIFRTLAAKKGMTVEEFSLYAEKNTTVDEGIDKKILETAAKGNMLIEGRLAGHMMDRNGVQAEKIWLEAPLKVRAERVAKRDSIPVRQAVTDIQNRERSEWERYYRIYGIDLNDLSIYGMVIDTSAQTPEEVAGTVVKGLSAK